MARHDIRNRAKYRCSRRVPGMSLLRADFTTHEYSPHIHDTFVIAVTEFGGAEISSERAVEKVCPSTLFVSNPEERQSARMGGSDRWQYRSIYVSTPAIELIARGLGIEAVPYFTQNMFGDVNLIERFNRLHLAFEAEDEGLCIDELLLDTFGALFRRYGSGGKRPEPAPQDKVLADRVVDLMRARYKEHLQLDELANSAGLTGFQLIRLFKRTTGLTPHAYLIHIRLNAACHYLKRGCPPANSALAAGFCDQSALTKHFKRCYGITPLQFAEAARLS